MSEIESFYAGKSVLVTGVTGFIGKVLVEKLLRTCPNIARIYLFVRPKKGKTAKERNEKIFENIIFDSLKSTNPDQLKKCQMIDTELSSSGLNLSYNDEHDLIENCNIILHIAASVQFDRSMHEIAETNVLGLKVMLEFAKKLKNLDGFVFCSTAFSQYTGIPLEEKAYAPPIKPATFTKILKKFDEDLINSLSEKMLGRHANTYVFTKSIAEDLVSQYVKYFPIAIARPTIVVNTAYEPIRGWTEGVNGFNACGIIAGFGVLKAILADENSPRTIIPVDITSNALIIIGWQTGVDKPKETQYYNLAEDISTAKKYPYKVLEYKTRAAAHKYPFELAIMAFGYTITTNKFLFRILDLWYHIFTGFLVDTLLLISGRKPMLLKVHRKIVYHLGIVEYYINNEFIFLSNKFKMFDKLLNDDDKKTYPTDVEEALSGSYFDYGFLGYRTYLLKQSVDTIPRGRRLQTFLYWLGKCIYATIAYFIIRFVYRCYF